MGICSADSCTCQSKTCSSATACCPHTAHLLAQLQDTHTHTPRQSATSLYRALQLFLAPPSGTQSELQALSINPATRFSSLFDEAQPGQDGKCPEGFSPAHPPSGYWKKKVNGKTLYVQCLKIKVRLAVGCCTVCAQGGQGWRREGTDRRADITLNLAAGTRLVASMVCGQKPGNPAVSCVHFR